MKEPDRKIQDSIWAHPCIAHNPGRDGTARAGMIPASFNFRSGSDELIIRNRRTINPN
jgi:hypothetical protein